MIKVLGGDWVWVVATEASGPSMAGPILWLLQENSSELSHQEQKRSENQLAMLEPSKFEPLPDTNVSQ